MNFIPDKAPSPTPPHKWEGLNPPQPRRNGIGALPLVFSPPVGEMGGSPEGVFRHNVRNVSQ